ncbi:MAG: hypothetical protein Q8Q35_00875 [Nanoarchaeota archaeon]|nr:hypothetical protein [Nanoarchaeota archaeon]
MKKTLFILLILLLLTACGTQTTDIVEDTTSEEIILEEQIVEEVRALPDAEPYYYIYKDETREILGKTFKLNQIYSTGSVDITIEGKLYNIGGTKQEEIIDGLSFYIDLINTDYKDVNNNYVKIKVEELNLENNQYIIERFKRITIGDKDLYLKEVRTDGKITLAVYDKGTIVGEEERFGRGITEELNGIAVTNIKGYYLISYYAIIQAEQI